MPATLEHHLTGGISNTDPDASLGGDPSGTPIAAGPLNNLFDDVLPDEAVSGKNEYRAIDVVNSGDANAVGVESYMDPETSSSDTQLDFGLEPAPLNSTLSIADEETAPVGVSFAHYTEPSRLALPDIPNGQYCRLWIRRVVSPGAVNDPLDQGTIRTSYA